MPLKQQEHLNKLRGNKKMKYYIDTANVDQIEEVSKWGIIDGVTTNPSLIAKEGRDLVGVINEITALIDGPISAEVKEASLENMFEEAKELAKLHKNIVIKVPMTLDGIKLTKKLSDIGIKTNVTLVFSAAQALSAAKAGATYVSPFLGRLDDDTEDPEAGFKLLKEIVQVFDNYNFKTQIIAASIRHAKHVEQAALAKSHIATIPYKVLKDILEHPLTTKGLEIFAEASNK